MQNYPGYYEISTLSLTDSLFIKNKEYNIYNILYNKLLLEIMNFNNQFINDHT